MNILHGKIQSIHTEGTAEFKKKILTLSVSSEERCFIEVRNEMLREILKNLKKGDKVQVAVSYEGKISKSNGNRFNNIIAKTLDKL